MTELARRAADQLIAMSDDDFEEFASEHDPDDSFAEFIELVFKNTIELS